jgi:ketosteroid isomerase-like protein
MLTPADHTDIHQVLADYGHIVDDHDWDRAEDAFVTDVVFETGSGQPVLHGIVDIVATFKGRNAYAHHTTNVTLAENDDDTVHAHSKLLCFPNEGPPFTGDYYDTLVRTPAGWRIAHRRSEVRHRQFFD